jgi:hypothetical protein
VSHRPMTTTTTDEGGGPRGRRHAPDVRLVAPSDVRLVASSDVRLVAPSDVRIVASSDVRIVVVRILLDKNRAAFSHTPSTRCLPSSRPPSSPASPPSRRRRSKYVLFA